MNTDLLIVLVILAVTLALFVSDRLRLDLIALMALLALALAGVVSTSEAIAGFAEPVVLMIAGLFVVGAGLFNTGVADAMGRWVERVAGQSPARLIAVIMLVTAFLSAFLSSTGTVAVMLPVVIAIAHSRGISPSRLLIPLAFASLLGGMQTLIGTPPNLIASNTLAQAGLEPFGFFEFTPVGAVMLVIGIVFMVLFSGRLVPERSTPDGGRPSEGPDWLELFRDYTLDTQLARLRLPPGAALSGRSVLDTGLRSELGITILAIASDTRGGRKIRPAEPGSIIRSGDELYVSGPPPQIETAVTRHGLELLEWSPALPAPLLLVEALVPPRSGFIGRSLRELRLRSGRGITVLGERPAGAAAGPPGLDRPLAAGDALLLTGRTKAIATLGNGVRDLVLLGGGQATHDRRHRHAPVAIAIMLAMMTAMTFGLVANVIAVLGAAVLLVLTRCLSMEQAYRSVNWESVVLIAAIIPMATALDNTGGMALAAEALLGLAGDLGPLALMAALFLFTSALSQVVSNTATTVLVAPIALQAALTMGVNPHAMLMTVAIAASTAFATPVASPVNTLVLNPGGYRFADFARAGIPLQLLILGATLLVVPRLFPF